MLKRRLCAHFSPFHAFASLPAMKDQKCAFPRGKALGGSSTINYMIYNRGNRRDFDQWAKDGNYGWSYAEVLPYFKKSESARLKRYPDTPYHGHEGGLSVEDVQYRTKIVKSYMRATKESGYQTIDYNGETQSGSGYLQANTRNGIRHSAASAFLTPIRQRMNLHILTNTRVVRVLIDPLSKVAFGVDIHRNKQLYSIRSRKEVILSAGTFGSAQLLMLSGVGPRNHLQSLGIDVIQDAPVGETMYDHFSHFGPTFIVNTTRESPNVRTLGVEDMKKFIAGTGKGTIPGGVEALTFVKYPHSTDDQGWPDSEIVFAVGSMGSDEGTAIRRGMRVRREVYNKVYKPLENENIDVWTAFVMQFRPKSVGYMKLTDKNPYHWPKFYTNWITHPYDEDVLLHGIKETIRISQAPAMQRLGARLNDLPIPGCEHLHFGSDNYWRCSIRNMGSSLHHQVATCKMGPQGDKTAVVSPELLVYGIQNLRVADCSVIPRPLTGHTNAVSFMIGEKLADMLLARHRS